MKQFACAAALIGLLAAQSVFAQENEVTAIRTSSSLGNNFSMLIFSKGLGRFGPAAQGKGDTSNLHFKLAVSRSEYDSTYDGVSGRGTDSGARFLLAYSMPLSESTTTTLIGGVTNHRIKVRPVTASSPSDTDEWGGFVSADLYAYLGDWGSMYALAEYDGAGSRYAMASYVRHFGRFNIGPSIGYTSNRDYRHTTLGIISSYTLDKNLELILSAGKLRSRADFSARGRGDYLDLIVKFKF